jgi:glycine C-acetyltransferase
MGDSTSPPPRTRSARERLAEIRADGLHRRMRLIEGEQGPRVTIEGRELLLLCSNNYLGLAEHPEVRRAGAEAYRDYGAGSGSSRLVSGNMAAHEELERRLAEFHEQEAALLFGSGYLANTGVISALARRGEVVYSDALNHASIIDGCRLSRAGIKVFPHKDVKAARTILEELPAEQRKLLITDGVFSMDGDLGALPELCALAEEFGCIMMVDDAHASGVFGKNGRGTIDHFEVHGRVDIQVGTLSKAMGALGGYVAGSAELIDFLYHRARPFLFSTSHPPSVAATCLAALDILEEEPEIIAQLWENTRFFKTGLKDLGFDTGLSESPITPVMAGEGSQAMKLSDRLFAEGVFAQGIAFPTVARDKARVRTIVTATHTRKELQFALDTFARVGKELGLI